MADKNFISDELFAAYLDGNVSEAETRRVLQALKTDKTLQKAFEIALSIDDDILNSYDVLPMMNLAAENSENICSVLCEAFVLHKRDVACEEQALLDLARKNNWLKPEGAPLHSIGQLLSHFGLLVTRKYNSGIDDIVHALSIDNDVIVAVDSDKLYPGRADYEDAPNHAVVVLEVNDGQVRLFDPAERNLHVTVSTEDFVRAWNESKNYMVDVLRTIEDYIPHPIDLDNIQLNDELVELMETIAENDHEVWASNMTKDGWTFGQTKDDEKKTHPNLIPYSALSDSVKEHGKLMALDAIKLVIKLGFRITRQ